MQNRLDSTTNNLSILLEANLKFLSANLQLNSLILNTLNNTDALDENQSVLNTLLNWLKSVSQLNGLNQDEITLIESLKESVRKSKAYDFVLPENKSLEIINNANKTSEESLAVVESSNETSELTKQEGSDLVITSENQKEDEEDQNDLEKSFFFRTVQEEDRWNYLSTIQSFITSYEHLMHLLIPNLAFEVVIELHRYDSQNKFIINEAISYPSVHLQTMITKFLREAPGSNLFRRIRRIQLDNEVDIKLEQAVNIGERQNIKKVVGTYFETLTKFLDPSLENKPKLETLEEQTKLTVKQFSLGPASVEMRLTAVIKHATESALGDAENVIQNENASINTKVIYLATTLLICDFQNFLLNEPRIVKFLEDLKS